MALESREEQFVFPQHGKLESLSHCFIPTVGGYTCKGSAVVPPCLSLGLAKGQRCFLSLFKSVHVSLCHVCLKKKNTVYIFPSFKGNQL